jgi:hypothetical protein
MKKLVLLSLFAVAVAGSQPAFAAGGLHLCAKGLNVCACGKLPAAMWQCCRATAKCDCSGGLPNCKNH